MIKKASRKDIMWGYLSQFLNVGSGIIIIPVAIRYLTTEDLGLWYLFIAIASLAQLLELGLQPTISRMTSYVYSGAKKLRAEGLPDKGDVISPQLLFDLIYAARNMYKYVSIGSAIIFIIIGTLYLSTFDEFKSGQLLAWVIFSLSSIINLYFTYFNGLISGRGDQKDLYRVIAISKFTMLLIAIPLLINQFGLLSMSISTFISMLVSRVLLYRVFYINSREEINQIKKISSIKIDYCKTLWMSSWKLGVTSLGSFLILRSNIFIASSFFGLKVSASYGLTVQVISILSSVSSMIFSLNLPKLNSLQSVNDKVELRNLFKSSLVITHFLYFFGAISLILIGVPLLGVISKNTQLVSFSLLIFMLVVYQLELNHSLCATYLTTLNRVPFVYSSLISGAAIVLSSLVISSFTTLGIFGLVLSQFLIQIIYNNWYWPLIAYRNLKNDS